MTQFTRTQAFRSYARMFQLPGSETLRFVDTSVATPVVDLEHVIRDGLGEYYTFTTVVAATGASQRNMDPWDENAAFNSVVGPGRLQTATSPTIRLSENQEGLIVACGGRAVAANVTTAWFGLRRADGISTDMINTFWLADGVFQTFGAVDNVLQLTSGGSEFRTPLPWPISVKSGVRPEFRVRTTTTDSVNFSITVLAAPRGVLPIS